MDPISAVASILSVLDIALRTTSALVQYAEDTRSASTERRILAEEASCLLTILQRLFDRTQNAALELAWLENRKDLVRQFRRAYDDLAAALRLDITTGQLKPESRFQAIRTAARWSFNKSEVYSLVERVTRLQQHANLILLNDQSDLLESMEQNQRQADESKVKTAVLSWLSPLEMGRIHRSIAERAQEGSGRWLLNCKQYSIWRSGNERLLWCHGIPGAGKTVITSIVIDHLRVQRTQDSKHHNVGVAMVYLKYNDPEQTLTNILASLLKQLIQEQSTLPSVVRKLYEDYGDTGMPPTMNDVSAALLSLLDLYSETFFVIDALDECSDETRWGLIEKLREFEPHVCLMVLSRFRGDISEELKDFQRLEVKADKADIELFIDTQIQQNANLRRIIAKSPSLRGSIKEGVVRTAKGMFLLARLHVNSLASAAGLSIRHVRNRLDALPTTLMTTYDEAMIRITSQDDECKAVALHTLAWVNYAFRSLSLKELQHALAIEPGSSELDEELIMDAQSITALCAGLITVEPGTDVVNFVHYTAYDYFEDKRQIYFPNFHGNITMSCATYLTMPALHNTTIGVIVRRFPLACYAAQFMGDHARQHPEETLEQSILETIYQLLSHSKKRQPLLSLLDGLDLIRSGFYAANQEEGSENDPVEENDAIHMDTANPELLKRQESKLVEVTALHLAASMGLAKVASMLVKENPNIDAVDETGKTALAVAIERGFEKAVEFLVNSGARIDLKESHGQQIFLLLMEKRWNTITNIVAQKAKANATAKCFPVHLVVNAFLGDVKTVANLLAEVAPDTDTHGVRALALFISVERANLDMLQTILASGVEVDSRDSTGQTSLHRATRAENEDIIRALLNHGAKVDSMNDEWRTPWSANVNLMKERISHMLIEAGANPNTKDYDGATVLYYAAAGGHTDLVRFMLKAGADPSITTNYDWAPLHWAAYHPHFDCVKLLIDAGADLSPISDQGMTPLDLAFKNNQDTMANFLIKAGAKEAREKRSETPGKHRHDMAELENAGSMIMAAEALTITEPDEAELDMKITFTFDRPLQQSLPTGQFVYPDVRRSSTATTADVHSFVGEKIQPYQISHMLDSLIPSISIRRSATRPDMNKYPLAPEMFVHEDVLYDVLRVSTDYQELEISGNSPTSLPGIVKMRRAWSGSWKAHHDHAGSKILLLQTTPEWSSSEHQGSRWTDEDGRLLARTGGDGEFQMRVEQNMKADMMDVLVVCWIAKRWSDTLRKCKG